MNAPCSTWFINAVWSVNVHICTRMLLVDFIITTKDETRIDQINFVNQREILELCN